jgi:cyanophycinase
MSRKPRGTLIIIGGSERGGEQEILYEVAKRAHRKQGRRLLLVTVASREPEESVKEYKKIFRDLGVTNMDVVNVRSRDDAFDEKHVEKCHGSPVIFFTGGDQLRITSQIGDTPLYQCFHHIFTEGGVIVGTSAGAAAMPETMLVSGQGEDSSQMSAIGMAPGLGLLKGATIDTHFAERGRLSRIVGAVAQNPRNIGIGIDEDTAIIVKGNESFRVLGKGAVYIVDGTGLSYSSLSEGRPEGVMSVHNLKLHVLAEADRFDLETREPVLSKEAEAAIS